MTHQMIPIEMKLRDPRLLSRMVAKVVYISTRYHRILGILLMICILVLVMCIGSLVAISLRSKLGASNSEQPGASNSEQRPNTNDIQAYYRWLYEEQEARLRLLGCNPVKQVVKIVTVLKEIGEYNELRAILKPYQAVVVRRCLPEESYCPKMGDKCAPTVDAPTMKKKIAIEVYNATLGKFYPIIREAEEHSSCTCRSEK